jgi:hypothetical protein
LIIGRAKAAANVFIVEHHDFKRKILLELHEVCENIRSDILRSRSNHPEHIHF